MDELTRERYGPVLPTAESDRLPVWRHGDGRPDTPERIEQRRRDLMEALWPNTNAATRRTSGTRVQRTDVRELIVAGRCGCPPRNPNPTRPDGAPRPC